MLKLVQYLKLYRPIKISSRFIWVTTKWVTMLSRYSRLVFSQITHWQIYSLRIIICRNIVDLAPWSLSSRFQTRPIWNHWLWIVVIWMVNSWKHSRRQSRIIRNWETYIFLLTKLSKMGLCTLQILSKISFNYKLWVFQTTNCISMVPLKLLKQDCLESRVS